jgi:hypothetical protein
VSLSNFGFVFVLIFDATTWTLTMASLAALLGCFSGAYLVEILSISA